MYTLYISSISEKSCFSKKDIQEIKNFAKRR